MDCNSRTSTNDNVLQGGTVLEDEDGISVTALSLASALDTTAVGLETTVEGSANGLGLLEGNRALGLGDGESSTLGEAEELVGSLLSRAGNDGSHEGSGGSEDSELDHFERLMSLDFEKVRKNVM